MHEPHLENRLSLAIDEFLMTENRHLRPLSLLINHEVTSKQANPASIGNCF